MDIQGKQGNSETAFEYETERFCRGRSSVSDERWARCGGKLKMDEKRYKAEWRSYGSGQSLYRTILN